MKKVFISALFFLFILFSFSFSMFGSVVEPEDKKEIIKKVSSTQVPFLENKGQIKDEKTSSDSQTVQKPLRCAREDEQHKQDDGAVADQGRQSGRKGLSPAGVQSVRKEVSLKRTGCGGGGEAQDESLQEVC